jgi:glutamate-ammonia-ligase adenylyltransferase
VIAAAREAGLPSVDPRLRGEGEGSPLAQTVGYYRRYFEERGDFWELLTFSRCRFICGDAETAESFERIVGAFAEREDVKENFKREFIAARGRLETLSKGAWDVKHDAGGLYDINFILAAVNLLCPPRGRRALTWEDSIESLRSRELLRDDEIDHLATAFALFYITQHAAALHGGAYPPLPEREEFLDSYLGRLLAPIAAGEESFTARLGLFKRDVREIFERFVERAPQPRRE